MLFTVSREYCPISRGLILEVGFFGEGEFTRTCWFWERLFFLGVQNVQDFVKCLYIGTCVVVLCELIGQYSLHWCFVSVMVLQKGMQNWLLNLSNISYDQYRYVKQVLSLRIILIVCSFRWKYIHERLHRKSPTNLQTTTKEIACCSYERVYRALTDDTWLPQMSNERLPRKLLLISCRYIDSLTSCSRLSGRWSGWQPTKAPIA